MIYTICVNGTYSVEATGNIKCCKVKLHNNTYGSKILKISNDMNLLSNLACILITKMLYTWYHHQSKCGSNTIAIANCQTVFIPIFISKTQSSLPHCHLAYLICRWMRLPDIDLWFAVDNSGQIFDWINRIPGWCITLISSCKVYWLSGSVSAMRTLENRTRFVSDKWIQGRFSKFLSAI
jgi:hypothetical protein